jgi:hypothetical protein
LKSLVLDERGAEHHAVPALLQQIAISSMAPAERKRISRNTTRFVFQAAIASRSIDYWDFQAALFALLSADCQEEAGFRFDHATPSLMDAAASFKTFETLFLILNSEHTHLRIVDPFVRWMMLHSELQLRLSAKIVVSTPPFGP